MNNADDLDQRNQTGDGGGAQQPIPPATPATEQQNLTIQQAIDLAVEHHKKGELPQAESLYQQILHIVPDQPIALHLLGLIAGQVGKNDEAVTLITKALAIHPDYAEAHNNLGNVFKKIGRFDDAVASYRSALAIQPDNAETHSNLGVSLIHQGEFDAAVTSIEAAIALDPNSQEFRMTLTNAMQKRVEEYIFSLNTPDQDQRHSLAPLFAEPKGDALTVNLVYCPFVEPITPPLGMASLKAYLEKYGDTHVRCMDLNLEWHTNIAKGIDAATQPLRTGQALFQQDNDDFFDIDQYGETSVGFAEFIRKTHNQGQYDLCRDAPPSEQDTLSILKPLALDGNPDVVGFSILFKHQILCSLLLAKEIKRTHPETIIVFGGAGMLSSGQQIIQNPDVDFVVFEAGEAPFLELLNCIKSGTFNESIRGVAFKKDGAVINTKAAPGDLNHEAYPDFSEYPLDKYFTRNIVIPILSSKGCFWRRCSFCEEGSINQYSTASVRRVIDELEHHAANGQQYFQFVDEMITPERLRLISTEILRRKLKVYFYGTLRPSADFNAETLQLMHDAGWRYVIWGIESCHPRLLKLVRKGTSITTIQRTLKASTEAGIRNHIFMIVGFPSETPDELFETMQFIYDHKDYIHAVHAGVFLLYSGTEIFLNPEKFEIEIDFSESNKNSYAVKHKDGATGAMAGKYFAHYRTTFLDTFPITSAFVSLRDHALLHYAHTPLADHEKIRQTIPRPVPARV